MNNSEKLKKLNELFGSYRAEWLKGKIYQFFTEPSYFTALKGNRPCILQGGRGTGKTTVLKGLSYQGQFALHNNNISEFDKLDFIGIYHRANTNHVRAFVGGSVSEENWQKIFGHYFNLVICREILLFIDWHKKLVPSDAVLSSHSCNLIAKSMIMETECHDLDQLLEHSESQIYEFQSAINNIYDCNNLPNLSMPGDPIKLITEHTISLKQFENKIFYILLDEYENFENNQQQLLNTLLKHNTEFFTFKIGVRELGWRVKHTLNMQELLHDPADYVLISIEQKLTEGSYFDEFAKNVCQPRLEQLFIDEQSGFEYSIEKSLTSIQMEDEALELGVEDADLMEEYKALSPSNLEDVKDIPMLYQFFISYWAKFHNMTLEQAIVDYKAKTKEWDTRYDNYKYDMLFKIRKNKNGIMKYYSGWTTYTKLANGNIRYLMELVYRAYEKHLNDSCDLKSPVNPKNQTIAAQEVGRKNLMELEGLWKNGAQLTKLLLGFGKIFNVLAREGAANRPEVNQFTFDKPISDRECEDIITAAVMNLAIVRLPGNKLTNESDTRDYLYTIHPIFAPYFIFSYRKKRKMTISEKDFLGIISNPKKTIPEILSRNKVHIDEHENDTNPKQLTMFKDSDND